MVSKRLKIDEPAYYLIQIQGTLSPRWTDFLAGLKISVNHQEELSTLEGIIDDQAALLGILNSLYSLGFPLLSVKLNDNQSKEK